MSNILPPRRAVCQWGLALLCLFAADCGDREGAQTESDFVVVYTALDEMYSAPIFQRFTEATGIEVRPVFDTESNKTVGLVNRLLAEAAAPRCDVFWNNEIVRTLLLKNKGLLEPYASPQAAKFPPSFKDPDGYWTGFAGRARVLIYNKTLVPDPTKIEKSIWALADPQFRGKAAIAKPLFGTTSSHAAFLFQKWGKEETGRYFSALRDNDAIIAAGNATVRDMVAAGQAAIGLTDTDDANGAILDGRDVGILFPDSPRDKTLVIPNTLALIKGAPHVEQGRKLIDYLLSGEVEETLSRSRSAQIPLAPGVKGGGMIPPLSDLPAEEVDWEAVAAHLDASNAFVEEALLAPR